MISVVCVFNSAKICEDWLLAGLKRQAPGYELITVDNSAKAYPSAAEALNYGGSRAKGDYLLFVHQDVLLLTNDWLERAESILEKLPDLGVAGVAGMRATKISGFLPVGTTPVDSRFWAVCHGRGREPAECRAGFDAPAEVQTLDEQLLIVPRKVFDRLPFDERACVGWHLYGVDYSLSVKKMGLKAYALPLRVAHLSGGAAGKEYYSALTRVLEKHREAGVIYTTCGLWRTSVPRNVVDLLVLAARSEVGRWLGRNRHGAGPSLRRLRMLLGL